MHMGLVHGAMHKSCLAGIVGRIYLLLSRFFFYFGVYTANQMRVCLAVSASGVKKTITL